MNWDPVGLNFQNRGETVQPAHLALVDLSFQETSIPPRQGEFRANDEQVILYGE